MGTRKRGGEADGEERKKRCGAMRCAVETMSQFLATTRVRTRTRAACVLRDWKAVVAMSKGVVPMTVTMTMKMRNQ